MKPALLAFIKAYNLILSPWMGNQCRFSPTCSAYAHQAIQKHGSFKGSWLAVKRLIKCQPYYKGDFMDPVP